MPEVTVAFWIIKILTTGMGETVSDFLVQNLSHVLALVIGIVGFTTSMVLQFRASRYVPWVYWFAVVMVSVFGAMVAVLHVGLGVPYSVSAVAFIAVLAAIFVWWYRTLNMGYLPSGSLFIVVPLVGYRWLGLNAMGSGLLSPRG